VADTAGCEVVVAGQLFKRLETEGEKIYFTRSFSHASFLLGFIAVETTVTDELGLLSTRVRSAKGKTKAKGKSKKTRKEIQKAKYYFVESSKRTAAYADYFNPDVDIERRMMGLSEAVNDSQCLWSLCVFLIRYMYRMFGLECSEDQMCQLR
jgi:hypothetical protein